MASPFRMITRADVPQKWWDAERRPVPQCARQRLGVDEGTEVVAHVAIELPDLPMFRQWMSWYTSQSANDAVGVTMSARDQWRDREDDVRAMLRNFIAEGRPTVHPVIMYVPK